MNNDTILKNFDDFALSKRNSFKYSLMLTFFSFAVIVAVLVWTATMQLNTIGKIKVVERNGTPLKSTTEREEKLFKALVQNHCASTVENLNSFNRLTIKEHQAKSIFLLNRKDALRIFSRYKTNQSYSDAIDRNVTYETVFEKIESLSKDTEPFHVVFSSTLTIQEDDRPPLKFKIRSEGDLVRHTAQFPENSFGFYFKNYSQSYIKIESDETENKQS